ncbi:MAG TPA: hypothetical protein VFP34_09970 [Microlunatus sp.]|nr:hypothetical protein [Microlunatus sp.]
MGGFHVVVQRHERVIAVRDGAVERALAPGRHLRRFRTRYEQVETRERLTTTPRRRSSPPTA